MARPARPRLVRLVALATLLVPTAAGVLLIPMGPALAASSPFTITCPRSGGSAGGVAVTGPGQQCGTYTDAAPAVISASCQPLLCAGSPSFVVTSPSGSTLHTAQLGLGHPTTSTYTVLAGSPDGTYVATLSGGGANVWATLVLQAPPAVGSPTPDPTPTASTGSGKPSSGAPSGGTTAQPSDGDSASSTPSATSSSGVPGMADAAPSSGPGPGALPGGNRAAVTFPSLPPPAGIAPLPPLPKLPNPDGAPAPGPYGKTLPYDGSVTVAPKADKPTVLSHVADAFDDKQVAESIAAACLALLFAAHLRRFTRRPSGDAEL